MPFKRFSYGFTSNESLIFHFLCVQLHQKYIKISSDFSFNHPLPHTWRIRPSSLFEERYFWNEEGGNSTPVKWEILVLLCITSTSHSESLINCHTFCMSACLQQLHYSALPNNEKWTQKNISYKIKEYFFHLKKTINQPSLALSRCLTDMCGSFLYYCLASPFRTKLKLNRYTILNLYKELIQST